MVLLPQVTAEADIKVVAQKIRDKLIQPFELDGRHVKIGSSLGVAFSSEPDCDQVDKLIQAADDRMYAAKRAGGNRVVGSPERTTQ